MGGHPEKSLSPPKVQSEVGLKFEVIVSAAFQELPEWNPMTVISKSPYDVLNLSRGLAKVRCCLALR